VTRKVLILRPEPGAGRTAERARALGLVPVVAPLFTVRPLSWTPPESTAFEAVMLTSANAAREAGSGLMSFLDLPCYAVGDATAYAAREAGFADVRVGPADADALVRMLEGDGIGAALHLCGREHVVPESGTLVITSVPVYSADASDGLPTEADEAVDRGALVLLHSPRAAALFAGLIGTRRSNVSIAAISQAAAEAAGAGWKRVAVAEQPRDEALLELAAKLCQTERE
jgi:uroporphyrinogen-III synthase